MLKDIYNICVQFFNFPKALFCESLKIWFYDPLYICFEANDINFLFLPGKEAV